MQMITPEIFYDGDFSMIKLLALLPFIMMVLAIPLVNKTEPYIFGMPFILFWVVLWTVMTSVIMLVIYKFDSDK